LALANCAQPSQHPNPHSVAQNAAKRTSARLWVIRPATRGSSIPAKSVQADETMACASNIANTTAHLRQNQHQATPWPQIRMITIFGAKTLPMTQEGHRHLWSAPPGLAKGQELLETFLSSSKEMGMVSGRIL